MTKIFSIKIGDMVLYCPPDLDSRYHDFGIIININDLKSNNSKKIEFEIAWQKDTRIVTYSSTSLKRSINNKAMKLLNEK